MSRNGMAIRLTKLEAERTPDPHRPMVLLTDYPPAPAPGDEERRVDEATTRGLRRLYLVKSAAEQPTDEEWAKAYCE